MSITTYLKGIKPPGAAHQKMMNAYLACKDAGVEIPDEVEEYFDIAEGGEPDPFGVTMDLDEHPAVREYQTDECNGYEVDLKKLPPDITVLRFFNSW